MKITGHATAQSHSSLRLFRLKQNIDKEIHAIVIWGERNSRYKWPLSHLRMCIPGINENIDLTSHIELKGW